MARLTLSRQLPTVLPSFCMGCVEGNDAAERVRETVRCLIILYDDRF